MSQVVKDTRRSQLVLYSIRCLIEQKRSSNFNHSQQNPPVQEKESYLARNGERKKKIPEKNELLIPVAQIDIYCNNQRKTTAY